MENKTYTIDTNIYPVEVTSRAIEDFSEAVVVTQKWSELTFGCQDDELEDMFWEFMNYCIALHSEV